MDGRAEGMDRFLPPRISVSKVRNSVGDTPVDFLKKRLKYSSSS
jgi:hypothetical protein